MNTGFVPAHSAKLYLRHSNSTDVLTEEGRQINNNNLNLSAAYQEDGSPRMGLSREPADFAFAAYMKTKSDDVDSTAGKNVLQAMAQLGSQINRADSSNEKADASTDTGNMDAGQSNTAAETSKGSSLSVNA